MKTKILRYLKHISLTILALLLIGVAVLLYMGNSVKFNRNYAVNSENLDREGPYILYQQDSAVTVNYVQGTEKNGYAVKQEKKTSALTADVFYYGDSSSFTVDIDPRRNFSPEPGLYHAPGRILAISDIEGGYRSFRNLLINAKVADAQLNWIFGHGHLVLLGDFVDRGYFVTQVLYLIYRLELQAEKAGGKVHYILGNHEIMNMQGDHHYAAGKYSYVSSMLGLRQFQLYDSQHTFLGRWMHSKNVIEKIGDYIFTHGGLHPDFSTSGLSIDSINRVARAGYDRVYYPAQGSRRKESELVLSYEKSPFWYRGFFEDDLSDLAIDSLLDHFNGKQIIVGHTIQSRVRTLYDGRVIGIDVQHPQEQWGRYFPDVSSQALLIENGRFFRINDDGDREAL
ncbi:MAG: metallophosphoesterase [Bacteroidota bacterium]